MRVCLCRWAGGREGVACEDTAREQRFSEVFGVGGEEGGMWRWGLVAVFRLNA